MCVLLLLHCISCISQWAGNYLSTEIICGHGNYLCLWSVVVRLCIRTVTTELTVYRQLNFVGCAVQGIHLSIRFYAASVQEQYKLD